MEKIIVDKLQFDNIMRNFEHVMILNPNLKYIYNQQHHLIYDIQKDLLNNGNILLDPELYYLSTSYKYEIYGK